MWLRMLRLQILTLQDYCDNKNFYDCTIIYDGIDVGHQSINLIRGLSKVALVDEIIRRLHKNPTIREHPEFFDIKVCQSIEYKSDVIIYVHQKCWESHSDKEKGKNVLCEIKNMS